MIEDLNPQVPTATTIAQSLGLTPMEATLSMMLAQGIALRDVAIIREISYETARSQLRAVFSKLGVRRQSELVALIGRLKTSRF